MRPGTVAQHIQEALEESITQPSRVGVVSPPNRYPAFASAGPSPPSSDCDLRIPYRTAHSFEAVVTGAGGQEFASRMNSLALATANSSGEDTNQEDGGS